MPGPKDGGGGGGGGDDVITIVACCQQQWVLCASHWKRDLVGCDSRRLQCDA